jgi:fermentation-respiration switch protein FrsA (DUF1100 family)
MSFPAPNPDSRRLPRSWPFRLTRLLAVLALAYIGVIVVLMLLENRLLFHPLRASVSWEEPPNERVQDVELQTASGVRIHAWWCPPAKWEPSQGAMLYCHGNAGNLSHRAGPIAQWQRELREAVLIFDYPGYGRSEGWPSEAGCYAAADAAFDWLTQVKKVRPEDLLLYGGSLGGGVAVDLASRRPHRALILVKTFTSIPDAARSLYPWVPTHWLMRNRFDNLRKIPHCIRPIFIAHGTADLLVPFTLGERLFEAAHEPKYFLPMPGIGHNEGFSAEFFPRLRQFLTENAPRPRSSSSFASSTG